MKKLMMAAAIVCAAVMGQAAQCAWNVDWVYSNDGVMINTYDDGSTVSYWIVNMLTSTDTSGLSVNAEGALVNNAGYDVMDSNAFEGSGSGKVDGAVANGNYLAMVIYDADNGLYGVSEAAAVTGISLDPPLAGIIDGNVFFNDAEGLMVADTAVAGPGPDPIPEPTSGLLLVLGMAGLALRRRRA